MAELESNGLQQQGVAVNSLGQYNFNCSPKYNWCAAEIENFASFVAATIHYSFFNTRRCWGCREGCDEVRIWQCSNFERFHQIRNSSNVLSALFVKCEFVENPCSRTDFLCIARSWLLPESTDKLFSKIQSLSTTKLQLLSVQHNFCSVVCYIVLIWILVLSLIHIWRCRRRG